MRRLATTLIAATFASGCVINLGRQSKDVSVANAPAGTAVEIRLHESDLVLSGELLEVREDALVLLSARQVVLVPLRMIRHARFQDAPIKNGDGTLGTEDRSYLRLYSRYPSGISPQVMQELLRTHGQDAPRVLPP
jgi:hypothetical protein